MWILRNSQYFFMNFSWKTRRKYHNKLLIISYKCVYSVLPKLFILNSYNLLKKFLRLFNPFPLVDTFYHICSRRLFKKNVAKEEITHDEQFLHLPRCFLLCAIIILSFREIFSIFILVCLKSSAAGLLYVGKG